MKFHTKGWAVMAAVALVALCGLHRTGDRIIPRAF